MFLVSQNLANYMSFSNETVIRINLAWVENLASLESVINNFNNEIYIDLPNVGEGELTELRSSVVRREALARVGNST